MNDAGAWPIRTGRRLAVVGVLVAALTGCGDDDVNEPAATVVTAADTATTDTPSTITPITTASVGSFDDGDQRAIEAAFVVFFGGASSTLDTKVDVLQDGERYRGMLEDASANEQFQQMATDIREIREASPDECAAAGAEPPCAVVVHDLTVGGVPMAAAIESVAVAADGSWLVSADAWCSIVELGGERCP